MGDSLLNIVPPGTEPDWVGSYNGWNFGPGNGCWLSKSEGLHDDLPEIRDFDAARSGDHGYFDGDDLYGRRTVTLTVEIPATDANTYYQQVMALNKATQLQRQAQWLTFSLNGKSFGVLCKPRNRTNPRQSDLGNYGQCVVQFVATDFRIYDGFNSTAITYLPPLIQAGLDVAFDVSFQLPGTKVSDETVITNSGTWISYPVLVITGPAVNPRVSNLTTGEVLKFGFTLLAGDVLTVDMGLRKVVLNGSAFRSEAVDSQWWGLVPDGDGSNVIQFQADSYDPAASLQVQYRSAWA